MKNKKIALITGATRGIGLAIAKELANDGFLIVGTGTSQQSADGLKEELKSNNIEGSAYILDITDEHSVEKLYSDINKETNQTTKEHILKNVFFDLNKSVLRQESQIELNLFIKYLIENPNIKIELGGHRRPNLL